MKRAKDHFENLYLAVLALYLLKAFFDTTLFSVPWPERFDDMLRAAALAAVLLKEGYRAERRGVPWLLCISAGGVFVMSWIHTGYAFLLDVPILALGAYGVPYKRILKVYLGCGALVMATAAAGSCAGCIEDLIYFDANEKISLKHSFGIVYSTDFAAHVVYLLLAAWAVYDRLPLGLYAAATAALTGVVYFYSGAKCSTIVLLLFFAGMLYACLAGRLEKRGRFGKAIRCLDCMAAAAMPCCAAAMIFLMYRFDPGNALMGKLNVLLSSRLQLAHAALENYGVHMWGTAFDMIGGGGNTVWHRGYNFVDSSYCMVLIRYGLAVFLVMCAMHVMCALRAGKEGRRRLLIALALIAVHNAIEHHILELAYNIFLILPFARLDGAEEAAPEAAPLAWRPKRLAAWAAGGAACGVAVTAIAFWAAAYGKTLVTLLRLHELDRERYFIVAAAAIMALLFLLLKGAAGAFKKALDGNGLVKRDYAALAGIPLLLLAVWGASAKITGMKAPIYEEDVQKGVKVISALDADADSDRKIYVDDLPMAYRKKGVGISWNILAGGGMAAKEDVVLLSAKDKELRRLMESGFLFGELSGQEGIYTNDADAAQILEASGIAMNDFYSVERDVDMALMAEANGLAMTQAGGLLVEGEGKSLIHGPWLTLYRGKYRVEYRLKLNGTSLGDVPVAAVRLSSDAGRQVIQLKELTKADFDGNGECVYVLEADIWDVEGAEFLLFAYGDTAIEIESIKYKKVGRIG